MEIYIEVRNVYGNDLAYPDCTTAKKFCNIAQTETLTPRMLKIIQSMGYKIRVRQTSQRLAQFIGVAI